MRRAVLLSTAGPARSGERPPDGTANSERGAVVSPRPPSQPLVTVTAMPRYSPESSSQSPNLRRALELLLAHTGRRVKERIRSPHTLAMQEAHAAWMVSQEVPAESFGGAAGKFLPLGVVKLEAFTTPRIAWLLESWHVAGGQERGLSLRTVAKRKSTLRRALKLAVERGELERVPEMPEIGLPPYRPRVRVLRTYAELLRLMGAVPLRRAEWIAVAVWTVQRPGDTERMSWSDVDLRSPTPSMVIRSTKTRRPVGIRVKCPSPLVAILRARLARLEEAAKPPALTDPLVDRWPGVSRTLPLVALRMGLPPLTAMDLRHTGISWMVRRTGLTRAAQEWGGWSDFNMMSRHYAHALPAGLTQAADELASIALEGDNDNGREDPPPAAAARARAGNDNGEGG
jgi:integrase